MFDLSFWLSHGFSPLSPLVIIGVALGMFIMIVLCIDSDLTTTKPGGNGASTYFASVCMLFMYMCVAAHFGYQVSDVMPNIGTVVLGVISYFVIGTVWAFVKWFAHLYGVRSKFIDFKNEFAAQHKVRALTLLKPVDYSILDGVAENPTTNPDERIASTKRGHVAASENLLKAFADAVRNTFRIYASSGAYERFLNDPSLITKSVKPLAASHKLHIMQWIAFWPISFVWTLINDPVRKIVTWIYNGIKGWFQQMADSIFDGV